MALLGHNYLRTFASQATCAPAAALPLPLSVWPLLVELTSVSCMAYPTEHRSYSLAHPLSSRSIPGCCFAHGLGAFSARSKLFIITYYYDFPSRSLSLSLSLSFALPLGLC